MAKVARCTVQNLVHKLSISFMYQTRFRYHVYHKNIEKFDCVDQGLNCL